MKQWRKRILCKKAAKLALISFEMAEIFLKRHYIDSFFDKWKGVVK